LVLAHEAPTSDDFFCYYWLHTPEEHPYDVKKLPNFDPKWFGNQSIQSLAHLKWGLYRLFVDGLLWFGNVRTAYRALRGKDAEGLKQVFATKRIPTEAIKARGPALPLKQIVRDDRYLISEMACKSYGGLPGTPGDLKNALMTAFESIQAQGGGSITIRKLLEGDAVTTGYGGRQGEFIFSADDVLDETVSSKEDIEEKYRRAADKFFEARNAALTNTRFYLSMVGELDVYVATSMRTRDDFRAMAGACDKIFNDPRLTDMELRHFDPTLSAAQGHEDKGLIECLMVKCAKVLVWCAGEKESWGKDAEAAMALSQGKPVIFYCDKEQKSRFYKEVHPLSRLIDFSSGVAVGAIVTDEIEQVPELLNRIFRNQMEYRLERGQDGYLRLREALTDSVIRLQTSDQLLSETFWNHYHAQRST
jgi:hypothetical protein